MILLLKTIAVFAVVVGISVALMNIKMFFKRNGKLEKSCTAKHRVLKSKGIEDCETCGQNPLECSLDNQEHDAFIHQVNAQNP